MIRTEKILSYMTGSAGICRLETDLGLSSRRVLDLNNVRKILVPASCYGRRQGKGALLFRGRARQFLRVAGFIAILGISAQAHAEPVQKQVLAFYYGWYGNPPNQRALGSLEERGHR